MVSSSSTETLTGLADVLFWLERGTLFLAKEEIARKDLLISAQAILEGLAMPVQQQPVATLCAHFNRGALILLKAGSFACAEECIQKEIDLCCHQFASTRNLDWIQASVQAMINLARLHAQAGRMEDAITLLADINNRSDTRSALRLAYRLRGDDFADATCQMAYLWDRQTIENSVVADSIRACLYNEDYGRLGSLLAELRATVSPHGWHHRLIQEAEIHFACYEGRYTEALRTTDILYQETKGSSPPDPCILLLAVRAYRLLKASARAEQIAAQLSDYASQLADRGFNQVAKRIAYFLALDYARIADASNTIKMARFAFAQSQLACDQVMQVRSRILLSAAGDTSCCSYPNAVCRTRYAADLLLLTIADGSTCTALLHNRDRLAALASSIPTSIDLAALMQMSGERSLPSVDPAILALHEALSSVGSVAEQLV